VNEGAMMQPDKVDFSIEQQSKIIRDKQNYNTIHYTSPDEVQHEKVKVVKTEIPKNDKY